MNWFVITILASMAFAVTQVLDNYYVNRIFQGRAISSVFYGHLLKATIILIIFLILIRSGFPSELLPFFLLIAITEILYILPYFKSLQLADTSVVAALFSLGRVFVPVLAFLTIGEVLSPLQYAGFFLIIVSSALLTLKKSSKKLSLNGAFIYMLVAAIFLAIQAISYKVIFENIAWHTGYAWSFIFIGIATLSLLLFPKQRQKITSDYPNFQANKHIILGNVLLSLSAWAGITYAISLADVSLIKGIEATEPFFVMIYAILLKKQFPNVFKEATDWQSIKKKSALFVVLIAGIILVAI